MNHDKLKAPPPRLRHWHSEQIYGVIHSATVYLTQTIALTSLENCAPYELLLEITMSFWGLNSYFIQASNMVFRGRQGKVPSHRRPTHAIHLFNRQFNVVTVVPRLWFCKPQNSTSRSALMNRNARADWPAQQYLSLLIGFFLNLNSEIYEIDIDPRGSGHTRIPRTLFIDTF